MAAIENGCRFAYQESPAEDGIRPLRMGSITPSMIGGIVFEVGILHDHDLAMRQGKAGAQSRGLSGNVLMAGPNQLRKAEQVAPASSPR